MNLRLDSDNDILVGRSTARVEGREYVAQLVGNRLKTFHREWALDLNIGIPWMTQILTHTPDMDLIYRWIHDTIISTQGVREIVSLTLGVNKVERRLAVAFEVRTDFGNLTSQMEV